MQTQTLDVTDLLLIMDESDLGSFFMWSAITGIVMLVSTISYRAFCKKNTVSTSSSSS